MITRVTQSLLSVCQFCPKTLQAGHLKAFRDFIVNTNNEHTLLGLDTVSQGTSLAVIIIKLLPIIGFPPL